MFPRRILPRSVFSTVAVLVLLTACGDTSVTRPQATIAEAPTTTEVPAVTQAPTTTTTAAPTTTTAPPAPGVAAMDLVDELYATLNAGELPSDILEMDGEMELVLSIATGGLNAQFTHSCDLSESATGEAVQIDCSEEVWDDFYGPAGIRPTSSVTYEMRGDRLAIVDGRTCADRAPSGEVWEYLRAYDQWLVADVGRWVLWRGEGNTQLLPCTPYPFVDVGNPERSPSLAKEYVELVPEFLADSDTYPLGEQEALSLVEDHYRNLANGDWERVRSVNHWALEAYLETAVALNASFEHECEALPFRPDDRVGVTLVRCTETMSDDFYSPGGLTFDTSVTYEVGGDTLAVESGHSCWLGEPTGAKAQYLFEFQQWLRSEDRWITGMMRLQDATPAAMPCGPYPFTYAPDEQTVETLRRELAAFVAASPDWPEAQE